MSVRFASLGLSKTVSGSKPAMRRSPEGCGDTSPFQNWSRPIPHAATTPTPVTATRRPFTWWTRSKLRLDQRERLADGGDALELLLVDGDVELLFHVHHHLDEVEAVGIEIVGEVRF